MAYALASRLERAVKNAGVKYKKVSGWSSRGHGTMGSIQSVICHHTAGPKSGNSPSLNVVAYGRPGLSGPLAQLFLARDGTVYLVAAGISYHAGRVSSSRYQNSHAIGIEAEATGLDSWPAHQINEYAKLCKALCKEFGLSTSRVVGHKEAAVPRGRKPDPNFSMSDFRKKVGGAKGGVSSGGGTSGGSSSRTYKTVNYGTTLGLYDKGDPVKEWQIEALGYTGKKADGYFGPGTEKDTKALQKKYGLKADGLVGPDTWPLRLREAKGKFERPKSKPKPDAPKFPLGSNEYFGPKLGPANSVSGYYSHRSDLKRWQQRMKDRGWSITPDGLYGNRTAAVARKFQAEKGLAADSLIGRKTWDAAWEAPVT